MNQLRFSPGVVVEPTSDGVFAKSHWGHFKFGGSDVGVLVANLIPLLDGTRTASDVAHALNAYKPESVHAFLKTLEEKGLIQGNDPTPHGARTSSQDSALHQAHLIVIGLEPWGIASALQLAAAGVGRLSLVDDELMTPEDWRWTPSPTKPYGPTKRVDIAAHWASGYGARSIETFDTNQLENLLKKAASPGSRPLVLLTARSEQLLKRYRTVAATLQANVPALSAHIEGRELWLSMAGGQPGDACWNCLRMRRLAHQEDVVPAHQREAQLLNAESPRIPITIDHSAMVECGQLLTKQLELLLTQSDQSLRKGRVFVYDWGTKASTVHGVAPMPWCPTCGGAQALLDQQREQQIDLSLENSPPVDTLPDLLGQMEGWVDHRVGVIRSLDLKPAGPPLPLTSTTHLAHFTEGDPNQVCLGASCGGKSVTAWGAQVGAIGEAVERYSAARYRKSDLTYCRMSELDGDVLDPRSLCHYEDSVYESSNNPYRPFDPNSPIHWVEGHWYGTHSPVWVPAAAVYFGVPLAPDEQFLQVTSSGLAAGSSTDDAAMRAVFELMERDATMLTWLCQLPARPILLDQELSPGMAEVVHYLELAGVHLELYLLEVGVDLPVVFCLGHGDGLHRASTAASLSCHADLKVAVEKALLEQAHVGPYLATVGPERVPTTKENVKTLEDHALYYIKPGREAAFDFLRKSKLPPVRLSEPRAPFPERRADRTRFVREALQRANLRVATIDVTSPDVYQTPFRVARAVGVDIQPIHFGYHVRPLNNPRLQQFLDGRKPHLHPHPVA